MISILTPAQCRMARAALRWTLDDLVAASGVGRATCARLELGDTLKDATAQRLRDAFEAAKVSFVNDGNIAGVIVALEEKP